MSKLLTVALALALLGAPASASEQAVALPGQPAPLMGTLELPNGYPRGPGVLLLAGSGPTDRDGNQPAFHNDALRLLAHGLADCGVASLRADKRGVGFSAAAGFEEDQLTLGTYVTDAIAWLAFLRAQPRIASVGIVGHSEGALIGSMAAAQTDVVRLVLVAGPGRPFGALLRAELGAIDMAPVLRRRAEATLASLEAGNAVEFPPAGLATLFRSGVQPFLMSILRVDPVAELARSRVPALVVQGTTDLQVPVADAGRLAAARHGVAEAIFPGMNHVLRAAPAERGANLATYEDAALPLMQRLVPRICAFLHP